MRPYPVLGCEVWQIFSLLQEGKKKDSNFSYLSIVMRLSFSTQRNNMTSNSTWDSLRLAISCGSSQWWEKINILLATCISLMHATLALITLSCYNWFTCLSFKSLCVPFHTDDDDVLASTSQWLVLPRGKLASTNQKHYQDLGSDMSSVWNFCAHFSEVVLRQKQWCRLSCFVRLVIQV